MFDPERDQSERRVRERESSVPGAFWGEMDAALHLLEAC